MKCEIFLHFYFFLQTLRISTLSHITESVKFHISVGNEMELCEGH